MPTEDEVMCESLIEWFKTLNVKAEHSTVEELSDGVALAQALNQFSPDIWTTDWLSKIKAATSGANWRLKLSNIRKVVESINDYYTDTLGYNETYLPKPDASRIAENCAIGDMRRLLQLVLGCAVNCTRKDHYIQKMISLEQRLQKNLMVALQELEDWRTAAVSVFARSDVAGASVDIKALQEERDILAQKCYEANKTIRLLSDERMNLQQELAKFQHKQQQSRAGEQGVADIGDDGVSLGPVQTGSVRFNEMRRQLDILKEDLQQSEASREDLRMRVQMQDHELQQMQQRIDELTKNATELIDLRDEVDVLRESNEKLKVYETQLVAYKKKMEEFSDLKKAKRGLEDHNAECLQQIANLEEEAKRYLNAKAQIELFKKEIQDLHDRLDAEAGKNAKLEFENKNNEQNMQELRRIRDNLLKERNSLKETIEELKYGGGQYSGDSASLTGTNMSKELHPGSLLDKLQRLETENKALREGQGGQTALAQLLAESNKRCDSLRDQLKSANERILSLTHASQSTDAGLKASEFNKQIKQLMELNEQKSAQLEEVNTQNANMHGKITQLEEKLTVREQELAAADARYRKSVEKAKEVIKCLDPRIANVLEDKSPPEADNGGEESRSRLLEEQLMATAFYRLGVNAQKDAVESKIAMLVGQGQTFLGRQRQSAPRKSLNAPKAK